MRFQAYGATGCLNSIILDNLILLFLTSVFLPYYISCNLNVNYSFLSNRKDCYGLSMKAKRIQWASQSVLSSVHWFRHPELKELYSTRRWRQKKIKNHLNLTAPDFTTIQTSVSFPAHPSLKVCSSNLATFSSFLDKTTS